MDIQVQITNTIIEKTYRSKQLNVTEAICKNENREVNKPIDSNDNCESNERAAARSVYCVNCKCLISDRIYCILFYFFCWCIVNFDETLTLKKGNIS